LGDERTNTGEENFGGGEANGAKTRERKAYRALRLIPASVNNYY
jgi:hypothetical protein